MKDASICRGKEVKARLPSGIRARLACRPCGPPFGRRAARVEGGGAGPGPGRTNLSKRFGYLEERMAG